MKINNERTTRVWLVEDNAVFSKGVQRVVNNLEGMICDGNFSSVETAFAALVTEALPDVIL